jgi:hypothetical protein
MAAPNDRQKRDEKAARSDAAKPHLGDASFANQNIFNTERGQTEDVRRRDTLDETGEVTTAAVPDRRPEERHGD